MKRILEFEANLPDSQIDDVDIESSAGQFVPQAICDRLDQHGLHTEGVGRHSDAVWRFGVVGSGGRCAFFCNSIPPTYIITVVRRGFVGNILGQGARGLETVLLALEKVVIDIGGTNLRWFKTYEKNEEPSLTIDEIMRA